MGISPNNWKKYLQKNYHFAGNDKERFDDLQWAFDHKNIKAIWCARGGYGSIRIVDKLNFDQFKKYPKWLIGYSDITVLHNKLNNLGFETIHGMMAVNMEENQKEIIESIESLKNCLFEKLKSYHLNNNKYNRIGKSSGILVGGNLALLASQLGSNSEIDTKNKILFIEELVNTSTFRQDAPKLERAGFDNCNEYYWRYE